MKRTLWASVAGVTALLALAGCGSGSSTTSAGAAATSGTTAATSPATTSAPVATAAPTTTTTTPSCGDLSFSTGSEDTATNIQGVGLACADALALVRAVGPQAGVAATPPTFQANGFTCSRVSQHSGDHGPPTANWECTSGAQKVDFVRAIVA